MPERAAEQWHRVDTCGCPPAAGARNIRLGVHVENACGALYPRWEITLPGGARRLITDYAIRTYGQTHIQRTLRNLPPLPDEAWRLALREAWRPPALRGQAMATNQATQQGGPA